MNVYLVVWPQTTTMDIILIPTSASPGAEVHRLYMQLSIYV